MTASATRSCSTRCSPPGARARPRSRRQAGRRALGDARLPRGRARRDRPPPGRTPGREDRRRAASTAGSTSGATSSRASATPATGSTGRSESAVEPSSHVEHAHRPPARFCYGAGALARDRGAAHPGCGRDGANARRGRPARRTAAQPQPRAAARRPGALLRDLRARARVSAASAARRRACCWGWRSRPRSARSTTSAASSGGRSSAARSPRRRSRPASGSGCIASRSRFSASMRCRTGWGCR